MNFRFTRRTALAAVICGAALAAMLPVGASAFDENSTSVLNLDAQSLAVKGYDVVAYFKDATPTLGKAEFSATHEGATYRFASAADRDAFKANPAKYAPQYGGFCAMGAAIGRKLDGDPTAWKIVGDKLYLNVDKDVQAKWLEDVPGNLIKANANWPVIRNKAPKEL